jgi:tRNA (cmo5U34)-methyltransferase
MPNRPNVRFWLIPAESLMTLTGFYFIGRSEEKMGRMEDVKRHFEEEAREFDDIIRKLIPYYPQMVEAVVDALPFERGAGISIIDLGCGTGTVARAVKDAYPEAKLACLDVSEEMLKIAGVKLADALDSAFINADFAIFEFSEKYDAAVSSLAMHHLETDEDKLKFYKKLYSGLNTGGVLVNADVVLALTDRLQQKFMERWIDFMSESVGRDEAENKWIPKYYHEDRPAPLMAHLDMLKAAGFSSADVVWKYYNYAVYMAVK